jgi:hypothetical protein
MDGISLLVTKVIPPNEDQNEPAGLEQSWNEIRLSQKHRYFYVTDSLQL